jgi:hypothetical protein
VPLKELHDLSKNFTPRLMQDMIDALDIYKINKGCGEALFKKLGLRAIAVSYSFSSSLISSLHYLLYSILMVHTVAHSLAE